MILSDTDIKNYIRGGRIKIVPSPNFETQLGPASLDLTLDNTFKEYEVWKINSIDLRKEHSDLPMVVTRVKDGDALFLPRHGFVLAQTREWVGLPVDIIGRLEGRSSLARVGLQVQITAGKIDPGFNGNVTLEIVNMGPVPVSLVPGRRIATLIFDRLTSPAENPYRGKYQGTTEPTA